MIEAIQSLARALREADQRSAAFAWIGWPDLSSMWMTDLIDFELVAVLDDTIEVDARQVVAIVRVSGRPYLVETWDGHDGADPRSLSMVMAAS